MNVRDGHTKGDLYQYIGRLTKYGNPFIIGRDGSREEVIEKFRVYLREHPELIADVRENLAGKVLVCYCSPWPCHGDVLARLADGGEP